MNGCFFHFQYNYHGKNNKYLLFINNILLFNTTLGIFFSCVNFNFVFFIKKSIILYLCLVEFYISNFQRAQTLSLQKAEDIPRLSLKERRKERKEETKKDALLAQTTSDFLITYLPKHKLNLQKTKCFACCSLILSGVS